MRLVTSGGETQNRPRGVVARRDDHSHQKAQRHNNNNNNNNNNDNFEGLYAHCLEASSG